MKKFILILSIILTTGIVNAQLENYDSLISQYLTEPPESGFMLFQTPNYFPPGGLFQIYQDSTNDYDNNMVLVENNTDELIQFHHYKYKQTYKALDVEGAGCIEHFNTSWHLAYTQSKLATQLDVDVQPKLSPSEILDLFFSQMDSETEYAWNDSLREIDLQIMSQSTSATHYPTPQLLLAIDNYKDVLAEIPASRYTLAYKLHVVTLNPYEAKDYYLDASTGNIIKTRTVGHNDNGTCGAYNYGTNNAIDTERKGFPKKWYLEAHDNLHFFETRWLSNSYSAVLWSDCANRKDNDDNWGNTYLTSNSAHFFTQSTWDYFAAPPFNRHGMDAGSIELEVRVHWTEPNARCSYDPISQPIPRLSFGTLNGFDFSWEPAIVGHEYTHGVIRFTSDLVYEFESGALNESFADIFGLTMQAKMLDNNTTDWIIGNHITLPNSSLRSLVNPRGNLGSHFVSYNLSTPNPNDFISAAGQPDTYLSTNWYAGTDLAVDAGGVHMNSGVQNHWYYILANGASGTNDINDTYHVTGIGLDDASRIAYYSMSHLMSTSQYADARVASIQGAIFLFGACSAQHRSTVNAWHAVGVGNTHTCAPLSVSDLNQSVMIYPNPANGQFSISTVGLNLINDVKIYSISGKLVKTINTNASEIMNVSISELTNGTYIVMMNINNEIVTKKIIIQGNE